MIYSSLFFAAPFHCKKMRRRCVEKKGKIVLSSISSVLVVYKFDSTANCSHEKQNQLVLSNLKRNIKKNSSMRQRYSGYDKVVTNIFYNILGSGANEVNISCQNSKQSLSNLTNEWLWKT